MDPVDAMLEDGFISLINWPTSLILGKPSYGILSWDRIVARFMLHFVKGCFVGVGMYFTNLYLLLHYHSFKQN